MCRLALMNWDGIALIEKEHGLEQFFSDLEKIQGGHGNGFAAMLGNDVYVRKGMNLSCKDIAEEILAVQPDYALFHTRLASAGSKKDSNCHPFESENSNTVVAMNGTNSTFAMLGTLDDITDTEAALRTFSKAGLPLPLAFRSISAVFVGFHEGLPFVTYPGTGDLEILREDKALIFASSIPWDRTGIKEPLKGFVWHGASELPETRARVYRHYGKYFNNYCGWYGDTYYSCGKDEKDVTPKNVTWEDAMVVF